ncbi:MAG: glycosyltransferase family 2 protein [Cytophagales bacterium]|nr:MAG: glycosyltransferase family 2 protein [Cytophagales bacterium]
MNRVSVCMAAYNGEQFIERQLRSILSQLAEEDEIIISDDGSTDRTLQVVSELADNRIKVVCNRHKRGPAGNFETALELATGDYIILSDQDDIWLPDKVKDISELLANNDLVLTDCEIIDQDGKLLHPSFFTMRGSRRGFWHNLFRNSYIGCCMAFRRAVLSYALPFPRTIFLHDWWIGLLVELRGSIVLYEKPLIKYVRHGNNFSPTGGKGYGLAKRVRIRFFLLWNVIKRQLT